MTMKHELLREIRDLLRPKLVSLSRINGITTLYGKPVTAGEVKKLRKNNKVRIFEIVSCRSSTTI